MSLGGKTTETSTIDPDLKKAALDQLAMARNVGQLGFVPYQGATVAGLQPGQIAAMQNTNTGLEAFGLAPSAAPVAGDLSPYAMYQEQLAKMAPGQRAFIDSMFINPMTGAAPTRQFGMQPVAPVPTPTPTPAPAAPVARGGGGGGAAATTSSGGGGSGRATRSLATPASYLPGGVNTRNPGSIANTLAAQLTSKPKGPTAPTSSPRPISRSTGTAAAGTKPANSANKRIGGGSGSMSTEAAANKAAEAKAAAERQARDRIAAAERNRAAANKAAEAKAAAERQTRDRIAAAERNRSASNRAAANRSTRDAAQGKGGKSGPASGGNKSSGGSNKGRR
jgi:hypothetical protein